MLVDLLYFFVKILKYWEKNIGKKQKKKPNHENNKSSIATFNKNYLKYVKQ